MNYRGMGKTGYEVSEIGFGAWQIGGNKCGAVKDVESIAALNKAIDRGVNFIDTAASYGKGRSEKLIGEVLKNRTERVYVATKIFTQDRKRPDPYTDSEVVFSEKYLRESLEESLKNLSVEKLDILLLHTWSRAWNNNPKAIEVLHKFKEESLVENIGISTPPEDQNSVLELIKKDMLDVVQFVFNIFNQEAAAELLPVSKKYNVGTIIRVPLEEGALTGKYTIDTRFEEGDFRNNYFGGDRLERIIARVEKIKEDISETELSLVHAALLFILYRKEVSTVIPGMRNEKYVIDNTSVSDMEPLSTDLIRKLQKHNWQRSSWALPRMGLMWQELV